MADAASSGAPVVSVVVPVFNAGRFLGRCLTGLQRSQDGRFELIVVDDASTDDSAAIARAHGARVVSLSTQHGPAGARNHGVRAARGAILFFVDADVVVRPDAVGRVMAALEAAPDVAAVFGSYDDSPSERSFVSQYKNLYHHFTHQQGSESASTFWAGCGAIRRAVFEAVGGFDEGRYRRPSIEDIELGYRLRALGYRIRLDKQLQGTHLKRWTIASLLKADLLDRAVPWSRLILDTGSIVNDLNVRTSERVSAALVVLAVGALPLVAYSPALAALPLASLGGVVALNHRLYRFLLARRGAWFASRALSLHCLYYLYSSAAFAWCWSARVVHRARVRATAQGVAAI
jgi:hypothetical protein